MLISCDVKINYLKKEVKIDLFQNSSRITDSNHGFHRAADNMSDVSSKNVNQGRIYFNIRRLEKMTKLDMKQTKARATTTTTKK